MSIRSLAPVNTPVAGRFLISSLWAVATHSGSISLMMKSTPFAPLIQTISAQSLKWMKFACCPPMSFRRRPRRSKSFVTAGDSVLKRAASRNRFTAKSLKALGRQGLSIGSHSFLSTARLCLITCPPTASFWWLASWKKPSTSS
ncbi:Uncharacterised protein [Vibrio cholerae]|nr:Uncharacterised protein [Vibrio cholerae]CRZ80523.1 Uncharacterised protein [Vibrio cholerae]CSC45001.1 Uncharacterised protein [Vibrio cholerae]